MTTRHLLSAAALTLAALFCGSSFALDAPTERPILTISGAIGIKNAGEKARFDMKMLEALPQHSFTTRTPWYDRPVKFTGPLLADVMAAVEAKGDHIMATAINDYTITIPMVDAKTHKVIVARLLDDKPMPVREKGPLFVIYPFDSEAVLRTSTYYERSIWQLKSMEVRP